MRDHGRTHLVAAPHSSAMAGVTIPNQLYNPEHLPHKDDLPDTFLSELHAVTPSWRSPDA
eukprot:3869381-Amphidinium_carterae.2